MTSSVYVTGLEPGGGKSAVALGLAELLSRRVERLGAFRPLARSNPDPIMELLRQRYATNLPPDALTGTDYHTARSYLSDGRADELVSLIVDRYRAVARECDAVVVVGTDFGQQPGDPQVEPRLPGELGLNLRLANEFGATVLPVVDGHGRTAEEVAAAVRSGYRTVGSNGRRW